MTRKAKFQLDLQGGEEVLTEMAYPLIVKSTQAIASRAKSISGVGMNTNFERSGINVRGRRAIGTITTLPNTEHEAFKALDGLKKATDAGRV